MLLALPRELKENMTAIFSGKREAFATTLLASLVKAYGTDVLEWDGLTIQLQIKDDLDIEIPRKIYDKLMGLITVLATDRVYKEVPVFDEIISALNGRGVSIEQGPPTVEDTAWAVAEIKLNDPEPVTRDPKDPWSRDIAKYVRVVLDNAGYKIAPKILEFAPNRPIPKEGMEDPSYYAGVWGAQQEKANEIDEWVENTVVVLLKQLLDLGVELRPTRSYED